MTAHHHKSSPWFRLLILLLAPLYAQAIINPSLQPGDLFARYDAVLELRFTAVDAGKRTATLQVVQVIKGTFAATTVILSASGEDIAGAFESLAKVGSPVVAYVGQARRKSDKILLYAGGTGQWQVGERDAKDPASWKWTELIDPLRNDGGMSGTFNGANDRLVEMMLDKKREHYYFPVTPQMQCREALTIGRFKSPVRGVALFDIDGDGRLDIYAAGDDGDRVFLQRGKLEFVDATEALGLRNLRSPSVNFADVNADGHPDLLAGAVIHLGDRKTFSASELLPKAAAANILCAAFVEINGDGYPDVMVSRIGGGLHVFLNPGAKGGPFADATAAMGLDQESFGAALTGYFSAGDQNGDGRTDLIYAAGRGLLLHQDERGRFTAKKLNLVLEARFDDKGEELPQTLAGASCFAPLWRPDRLDLAICLETKVHWLGEAAGVLRNLTGYGNELQVGSNAMFPVIAEDLNADGLVDLYVGSRKAGPNAIYLNRGYGSFTSALSHKPDIFVGESNERGAWSLATGDADGDGVNDLLLGCADGSLVLIPNDSLRLREAKENQLPEETLLAKTGMLGVRVRGKHGVLGARVTLADAQGRIVGMREIGTNIATGCRGPDTVNLAVQEPGPCVLKVRYADGKLRSWPVKIEPGKHLVMDAWHPDETER